MLEDVGMCEAVERGSAALHISTAFNGFQQKVLETRRVFNTKETTFLRFFRSAPPRAPTTTYRGTGICSHNNKVNKNNMRK